MIVSSYRLLSALALIAALVPDCTAQEPWETCSLTEGKGNGCRPGDRPRPFNEYLAPGLWAEQTQRDWFSGEFQWDIKNISSGLKTTWREVGSFGPHRIRNVRFLDGESVFADLLLAESNTGIFFPLMKWAGQMPDANFYDAAGTRVLVVLKDFGGNIPMVQTWAWMWGPRGPIRLNVDAALQAAFHKLGPDYIRVQHRSRLEDPSLPY